MKLKRIISLTLAFLAVLSSLMILSSCNSDKKSSDKEDNGVSDSNYVSIDCDVLEITVTDDESAIKAIENVAESLGISDVDKELKIDNVTDVNQEKYYRMQQYYNDIPVYGKDIVLAVDDSGMATTVTSNVDPITETVDINATVSQKDVEKTISQYFTKVLKKGDDFNYSIPELKKEQQYIYKTEKGDFVLAYLVNTGFYDFLVDAKTSDVLDCISNVFTDTAAICYNGDGTEQFDGSFSESEKKYISYDMQRGIRVATYNKTNSRDKNNVKEEILKSVDNYFGNSVDADEVKKEYEKGVTLINNLAAIHDYFYKKYGENKPLNAYFNDGFDGGSNALGGYDTDTGEGYISMGYNTGVTDIDVMAYEYMHFISRSHVGWSRGMMIAGAINEGYSDIFGEIFESEFEGKDPDWLNRNDIINLNRNMASPSSSGYPEKISDENKSREDYSHAYSTVISHAAYLMWNGIDGNESMKIDVDTLADIWYRSILLLHSNADFQQCADAVYKSAKTLKKQITSEQLECVKKSFENAGIKVSLGSASTTCRGSSLYVNDINFEKYGNYHLKIFSMKDSQNPKIVLEKDVTDTNGVVLDFDAGVYTITVTDNDANGSKDEYSQIVNISKRSQYKFTGPVTIYTNFGGKTVSDFTMPAEKVVTLGEISVIEPELTPIDAASYSIKWSSSDESVATVSPNGEAGIITALAKGTATITAELTSGGKTITKTTSLRVASKARDTVLVLDVSGSMSGDPLDEMKKSAIQFCNDLLKDEYGCFKARFL